MKSKSLPINLPPLRPLLRRKLIHINLEELWRFLRFLASSDIAESRGRDIIGLALADEGVVFEDELDLCVVGVFVAF